MSSAQPTPNNRISHHSGHTSDPHNHPSGDERYSTIDRTIKLLDYQKDALLEVLNVAQETFGYLSEELLIYIAHQLDISLSKVYGVSTFYHMFTFTPLGKHNCIVCTGTACHVKGADHIVQAVSADFQIASGETTADGLLSLNTARCLGSCGLAPVTVLNGQVRGKGTPESVTQFLKDTLEPVEK